MSLSRPFAAALIAPLLLAADSLAASVTNRDAREHKLTVLSTKDADSRVLMPNEAWRNFCLKGCIVRLNGDENATYELDGSDVVSIEDGFIYYDRDDSASPPRAPEAAPSPPAK